MEDKEKEVIKVTKQIGEEELEIIKNGNFKDIFELLFSGDKE